MKKINIRPLFDNVVVQNEKAEAVTSSGIYLPENAREEKKQIGTVIAVGPGKMNENGERNQLQVKIGDKVVYPQYAGDDLKIEGEEYKVVSEERILAIIEE